MVPLGLVSFHQCLGFKDGTPFKGAGFENLFLVGGFKYFHFRPYLGKWSNLTNIFQLGWNHQLVFILSPLLFFLTFTAMFCRVCNSRAKRILFLKHNVILWGRRTGWIPSKRPTWLTAIPPAGASWGEVERVGDMFILPRCCMHPIFTY